MGMRFVYCSHKSLATCAITVIIPDWFFVVITVNTSVHVQVFTVTSILFTHNCQCIKSIL